MSCSTPVGRAGMPWVCRGEVGAGPVAALPGLPEAPRLAAMSGPAGCGSLCAPAPRPKCCALLSPVGQAWLASPLTEGKSGFLVFAAKHLFI